MAVGTGVAVSIHYFLILFEFSAKTKHKHVERQSLNGTVQKWLTRSRESGGLSGEFS
jgi:hypothetical protein